MDCCEFTKRYLWGETFILRPMDLGELSRFPSLAVFAYFIYQAYRKTKRKAGHSGILLGLQP